MSPAKATPTKKAAARRDDDDTEASTRDEVDQQATTTRTKDYLNRALTNPTPGTSQATDHLGRNVVIGNQDYLGRALVP